MALFGLFGKRKREWDSRAGSLTFVLKDAGLVYDDGHVGLRPTTITIDEKRVAVIGLNGAGKSSLLKVLDGSEKASEGTASVVRTLTNDDGTTETDAALNLAVKADARQARDVIGIVRREEIPQSYYMAKDIAEAVSSQLNAYRLPEGIRHETVGALFAHFGLSPYAHSKAASLDSEKRHLLAIVGALAINPAAIVADEPTKGLDENATRTVAKALFGYDKQVIFATHDLDLIADPAYRIDRVLVVDEQTIVFDGEPQPAIDFYNDLIRRRYEAMKSAAKSGE
ncbi:ATP-binding cassette domain-containing protein [Bifidobacterium simiarum]|uniref:ABC transporter ATP-binding protein n=1 Tax=Bifidobacterium simiarum TaxID=2045441 RepID=A0A2M9HFC9_9BIFI|nr:ATP-binding cassette domain-containing protein [Bifidobacterium simiarum]PJM75518.1 ABC transporter ATP-binding protein [Bifidobacterium simiarum]